MVQSNQFGVLDNEDPSSHLATFFEMCDTFRMNGFFKDAIHIKMFPFPLRENENTWLNYLPTRSITT